VEDLETSKSLTDRKYFKNLPKPLILKYLKYSYLSESFLIRDNSKLANMKYLNIGMDVDLLAARSLLAKTGQM
jgi:hypothetical protein